MTLKRTLSAQSIRRAETIASDKSSSSLLLASPSDKVSSPVSKLLEKGRRGVFEKKNEKVGSIICESSGIDKEGEGIGIKRPANDDLRRKVLLQSAKKLKRDETTIEGTTEEVVVATRSSPRLLSKK
jgi:hypothetical protein